MSKFNTPKTIGQRLAEHPDATTNYEDGLAFGVSPEMELYLRACTSLLDDKFYVKADQYLQEIRELIHKCSRKFVLQLASYVRNEMHLRSMPIELLAEASVMQESPREPKADVREYVPKIIRRADEPAELLAYWIKNLGNGSKKNLPNALRRGLSDALLRWDEYALQKYNRAGAVRLKDVINLVHPKPDSEERSALYKRALDGELATPDTWEVRISTQGATGENWSKAAESMGIFSLLRNLRNFEQKGAEQAIQIAIEKFSNPEAVRKSQLLPFRWYQAYREVTRSDIRDALHKALDLSLENIEPWDGTTVIIVDNSGSMRSKLSSKGTLDYIDVAALMGAVATHLSSGGYRVGVFANEFQWVPGVSRRDSVITNMQRIVSTDVGGSTYAYKALETMRGESVRADRIVLFSDMQCYNDTGWGGPSLAEEWEKYRRGIGRGAYLYSCDLAGYGSSQFREMESGHKTVLLAGWSENVLSLVRHYEQGETVLDRIREKW